MTIIIIAGAGVTFAIKIESTIVLYLQITTLVISFCFQIMGILGVWHLFVLMYV